MTTLRTSFAIWFFVLLTALSGACASTYQSRGIFGGGYSETRLGEHLFRVSFRGNGHTGAERASDFCMLRCGELTLEHGCRFFTIIDVSESVSHSTFTTPTTSNTTGSVSVYGNTAYGGATTTTYGGQTHVISRPRSTLLIACSPDKTENKNNVIDAKYMCSSIRAKYRLKDPVQSLEEPNQTKQAVAPANE